jgi:hypothetical protein
MRGGVALKDKFQSRRTKYRKLKKHRELLLESVRTHILPAFVQRGFSGSARKHFGLVDRKYLDALPFELFRRARSDGGIDLIEVQFMTYKRASFRINACAVPKEGMMTVGGLRPAEELDAGGLHDHFEMYEFPRWWIWFSLWFCCLRTPERSDYDKLALRVAGYLPEMDLALREGKLGPHMRKVVIPRPALSSDRSPSTSSGRTD